LCGIAASIYFQRDWSKNSDSQLKGYFESCQTLVDRRISEETLYVKSLIQEKSTTLLQKSINAYTTEYFAKNRLLNLQEAVYTISDLFLTIAKMVPEGTFECN
jgi:hypothetical protein